MKILITGAAKRVGQILSAHLAAKGHKIAIHYNHSAEEAEQLFKKLGGKAQGHLLLQCDLNNLKDVEMLLPEVVDTWGKPDVLINNASTYFCRGMVDFTLEEMVEDFTINFFSPVLLMRDYKKYCRKGCIINFVDRRVEFVDPEAGPYALAKKSLRDATLACAADWKGEVRVNAIAPGPVLLPGETYENAQHRDLLDKILGTVDNYIENSETGLVTVIE